VSRVVRGAPPTNNVAELEAIEDALDIALQETLKDTDGTALGTQECEAQKMLDDAHGFTSAAVRRKRLVVVTDSLYALRAVTEWHHSWARNGWRTTAGTSVKNIRLIQDIVAKLDQLPHVSLFHIRGHMHAGNIEADRLAGKASAAFAQAAKLA
jgi:ribonuclease HI